MNLEELEDELNSILPGNFHIDIDGNGQVVIYTGLCEDEDGELIECDIDFDEDEDEDEESDPDFEPLVEDDEDE